MRYTIWRGVDMRNFGGLEDLGWMDLRTLVIERRLGGKRSYGSRVEGFTQLRDAGWLV